MSNSCLPLVSKSNLSKPVPWIHITYDHFQRSAGKKYVHFFFIKTYVHFSSVFIELFSPRVDPNVQILKARVLCFIRMVLRNSTNANLVVPIRKSKKLDEHKSADRKPLCCSDTKVPATKERLQKGCRQTRLAQACLLCVVVRKATPQEEEALDKNLKRSVLEEVGRHELEGR